MEIPVARTIEVQIPAHGMRDGKYQEVGLVKTETIPNDRVALAGFVGQLFPENTIEHLGRTNALTVGYPIEAGFGATSLFFQAVHRCFNKHYPLALRPEVLAYLIAHEIAVTVNRHPETYRHLFTTEATKQVISVRHDGLVRGSPNANWAQALSLFETALRERVPDGIMQRMLPNFSTVTPESRAATLVAFMDAAQSFFDYRVYTLCGIPRIRLLGTPQDYALLVTTAQGLAEVFGKHLDRYFTHLLPVLRTIANQAAGAPADNDFWSKLYNYFPGSGQPASSGWITTFLAYTRAPNGTLVPKADHLFDWTRLTSRQGIANGAFPTHVSSAPFMWHYLEEPARPMTFIGGVLGIEDRNGFVCPELSYGILNGHAAVRTSPPPRFGR